MRATQSELSAIRCSKKSKGQAGTGEVTQSLYSFGNASPAKCQEGSEKSYDKEILSADRFGFIGFSLLGFLGNFFEHQSSW
jgi:hypothetical protein